MDLQIITRGIPASADEWLRVLHAPENELPSLTEEDRRRALQRHLNEDQYRRHLALRGLAKQREFAEAESLGRTVSALLAVLGPEYSLKSVTKRGMEAGWYLLIESRDGARQARVSEVYFGSEILGPDTPGSERPHLISAHHLRPYLCRLLGVEDALKAAS